MPLPEGAPKQAFGERFGRVLAKVGARVRRALFDVGVEGAGPALPADMAMRLMERVRPDALLLYRDITEDGLVLLDEGGKIRVGFGLEYTPFVAAGEDLEQQLEGIFHTLPAGAVVQFSVQGDERIYPVLRAWQAARDQDTTPKMLRALAESRAEHFLRRAPPDGPVLIEGQHLRPRRYVYRMFVTLPYEGPPGDEQAMRELMQEARKIRRGLQGLWDAARSSAQALDRSAIRAWVRSLLNPQIPPEALDADEAVPVAYPTLCLVHRETSIRDLGSGVLRFHTPREEGDWSRECVVMTVDGWPERASLPLFNLLIGDVRRPNETLPCPFFLYATFVVQDQDEALDRVQMKLAGISRQLISDSAMYRAFMGPLFDRRDEIEEVVELGRQGHGMVAGYVGINLYAAPGEAPRAMQAVTSLWQRYGFRVAPERYITLPVWLVSLPGQFYPEYDPLERRAGLQRISTMSSAHASMLIPVRGDFRGTPPEEGGVLLLSRSGQPATFWVQNQKAATNYNMTVTATSGAGKSFFVQDLLLDFLAKGGRVFVIDAGRSYFELCELLGGVNIVFDPANPIDLNPFAGIRDRHRLTEMMEMLKEIIRSMAWSEPGRAEDWLYAVIEAAIEACWTRKKEQTRLEDIAEFLAAAEDPRARDMAGQLGPYVYGRAARWFDGSGRPLDLDNPFMVLEMDELKSQGQLRDVVLTLVMHRIADAMYAVGNTSIPKLMLIDEAWDLLGSSQAGGFIERAYRTLRKMRGSACVITQSFRDYTKSPAARAAWDNSAWRFILMQKEESLETAFEEKMLIADPYAQDLLRSVHTAPGQYSEVFVSCDAGYGLYRFIVDRTTYWLFTTNAAEKARRRQKVDAYLKDGLDYPQALARACRELAAEDEARAAKKR